MVAQLGQPLKALRRRRPWLFKGLCSQAQLKLRVSVPSRGHALEPSIRRILQHKRGVGFPHPTRTPHLQSRPLRSRWTDAGVENRLPSRAARGPWQ